MTRARTLADLGSASLATDAEATAAASAAAAAVPTGAKNLLYNGAMQVAQRGTSTAGITASGYNTTDRWYTLNNTLGHWTQSIEADAPDGFSSSLKMLCTTADTNPANSDLLNVRQYIEGYDVQRLAAGTAAAQQLTISFWVKSNVTGTYIVELIHATGNRNVSASYAINAAATWEFKTVTFPAPTGIPAFTNNNATALRVCFGLGAGSTYSSGVLGTSWYAPTQQDRYVGQTNLAAATNNYWQITGVQLEVGDTATEFEHLPYGVELARCQRYYYTTKGQTINIGSFSTVSGQYIRSEFSFPVTMRSTPTIVADFDQGNSNAPVVGHNGPNCLGFVFTSTGSNINSFMQSSAAGNGITASAEL